MTESAARLIAKGQLCLWTLLMVCIGLHPGLVLKRNESGLSNYGIHLKTVVPYSLALALGAGYSWRAARRMRAPGGVAQVKRAVTMIYASLLTLSLLSTYVYHLSNAFNDVHVGVNVATACFEVVAGGWIAYAARSQASMLAILAGELTGFVIGALTIANVVHLVLVAEVLIGVGFGLLLYRLEVSSPVAPLALPI